MYVQSGIKHEVALRRVRTCDRYGQTPPSNLVLNSGCAAMPILSGQRIGRPARGSECGCRRHRSAWCAGGARVRQRLSVRPVGARVVAAGEPDRRPATQPPGRPSGTAACAAPLHLHRRAFDRAVRAENAAVAGLRSQHRLAVLALVEELAGVRWHNLALGVAALRACQHRLQLRCGGDHLRTVEGYPASVVALVNAVALVLSASNVTVAVFFAKSIRA